MHQMKRVLLSGPAQPGLDLASLLDRAMPAVKTIEWSCCQVVFPAECLVEVLKSTGQVFSGRLVCQQSPGTPENETRKTLFTQQQRSHSNKAFHYFMSLNLKVKGRMFCHASGVCNILLGALSKHAE